MGRNKERKERKEKKEKKKNERKFKFSGNHKAVLEKLLVGVSLPWKTEYPEGCSTVIRHVVRKEGLYDLKVVSL